MVLPTDLDLAGAEVALVIGAVVVRVPQTELDVREELDRLLGRALVLQLDAMHFGGVPQRNEVEHLGTNRPARTGDLGVSEPVATLELVELAFDRHVAGRPIVAPVVDVEVPAADVGGRVVVAVPKKAPEPRVSVEAIAARLVRDEAEEALGPEVVDPRIRGLGGGDDIFA